MAATASPMPSRRQILQELDRILASPEFSRSPQLSRFLRFAVDETLEGRSKTLKEYTIGVKVYERGQAFDPRVDPIVRVQASKLRARLAAYYANAGGAGASMRIELPKGGYTPTFSENRPPLLPKRAWNRLRLYVLAALALFLLTVLRSWRSESGRPSHGPNPTHLTVDSGWTSSATVSRDGLLAFASDRPDGTNVDIWVQSLNGEGLPRRLTTHPAIDWSPDFSPDGRRIVFRSFRDGGGIYSVPVDGGAESRLAAGGFNPRFSPDGRWILYGAIEQSGNSAVYVVSAEGGVPRRIQAQNFSCGCPVWTPDGRGLLFRMSDTGGQDDWWLAPFDPEMTAPVPARQIGFREAFLKTAGRAPDEWTCPGDWLGHDLFFIASDSAVYRMPFLAGGWRPKAPGRLVLPGPAEGVRDYLRVSPKAGARGTLIYSEGQTRNHLWEVPRKSGGVAVPEARQLTRDLSIQGGWQSGIGVSRDGRFLVFPSYIAGPSRRILLRDLRRGTDRPISPRTQHTSMPIITPDGRRVAWLVERDGKRAIFTAGADGDAIRETCANCGVPRAWDPGNGTILYTDGGSLWSLAVSNGARKCLFQRAGFEVDGVTFSPDGRWVAMVVGVMGKPKLQGVLAPFDHLAEEKQWILVAEEDYDLTLAWGAEGDIVYYLSRRDDFRCLYGQCVRASDKRPLGPPLAIRHFHAHQNYPLGGSPLAVALGKVVLALSSRQSNVWSLDVPGARR